MASFIIQGLDWCLLPISEMSKSMCLSQIRVRTSLFMAVLNQFGGSIYIPYHILRHPHMLYIFENIYYICIQIYTHIYHTIYYDIYIYFIYLINIYILYIYFYIMIEI
jgi:hypothetical protein